MTRRIIVAITVVLFATVLLLGCETTPTVKIPLSSSNQTCTNIPYTRICDSDIRAHFQTIAPSDKVLYFDSYDSNWPIIVDIWYTPENIGPHKVLTKHVNCIEYREAQDFKCVMARNNAYYDANSDKYLVATGRASPDKAELIVKLWMRGQVVAKNQDWLAPLSRPNPRYVVLDAAPHGGYTLNFHASGCAGPVDVQVEEEGEQPILRVTEPPKVICH